MNLITQYRLRGLDRVRVDFALQILAPLICALSQDLHTYCSRQFTNSVLLHLSTKGMGMKQTDP